jgi:hypothetical protein
MDVHEMRAQPELTAVRMRRSRSGDGPNGSDATKSKPLP